MTSDQAFTLSAFAADSFHSALAGGPCTTHDIKQDAVCSYLVGYLGALGAKTLIVELSYVDGDYLDDFANFYAKSFDKIPSTCRRLHFFTTAITAEEFLRCVKGEKDAGELQRGYLGFVVARPLPSAPIGRTALTTYPPDGSRRNYPTTRRYEVSLFGIALSIQSLAFQMQDTSLAACATVALWSCFQKTQDIFRSQAPTPVAITRSANRFFLSSRPFPSRGLQVQQICNAIASVGLDPEVYPVNPALPLVSLIYSYLRLGLPVLLLVKLEGLGGHAIALTGYSMRDTVQLSSEGGIVGSILPRMIGTRIDEFYAHDDQKGPFCRLKLESATSGGLISFPGNSWNVNITPEFVIVPVYPKIRSGFRDVTKFLPQISVIASWVGTAANFEWDVFLTSGTEFKKALRSDALYSAHPSKESLLLEGFPKYIWRCMLRDAGRPMLEILLDTTAMVSGFPLRHIIWHDGAGRDRVAGIIKTHENTLTQSLGPRLVEALKIAN